MLFNVVYSLTYANAITTLSMTSMNNPSNILIP